MLVYLSYVSRVILSQVKWKFKKKPTTNLNALPVWMCVCVWMGGWVWGCALHIVLFIPHTFKQQMRVGTHSHTHFQGDTLILNTHTQQASEKTFELLHTVLYLSQPLPSHSHENFVFWLKMKNSELGTCGIFLFIYFKNRKYLLL